MSSQELSAWLVLSQVRADEEKHRRDLIESQDGQVFDPRRDQEEEDDEDDGD
jgi:hypothetical protein